jgi:phosphomannomutase
MTLIKSISGIRGTIGGAVDDNLTPIDVVKFAAAYGTWLSKRFSGRLKVVIGRDARISGAMVSNLVSSTLIGLGIDVKDLGLSTTPTVEFAVPQENANGGIILTASHNPAQWNALKLLNEKGEFLSGADGAEILEIANSGNFIFADVHNLGALVTDDTYIFKHITSILNLKLVDVDAIRDANFNIVVDAVNSTGGIAVPKLLEALGVKNISLLHCEPTGRFAHNPEPLPEHLTELSSLVVEKNAHLGIAVDPDVDRLAFVNEDGSMFGEEYTLVAIADYVLQHNPGNTVSNLSSTRALKDVTENRGGKYAASAVGEVNVVALMKETNAVIGGEGNGGVIYPESHYGRDALVGIGLFLSALAHSKKSMTDFRATFPNYVISKNKLELTPETDVDAVLEALKSKFASQEIDLTDGVKIYFDKEWVHLRKSNTEPIIRIYSEAQTKERADALAQEIIDFAKQTL